jgi:serine-threonine kinase receptor-associated protein
MSYWNNIKFFYTLKGPSLFVGHTSNIKKVLLSKNDKSIISISDDKTLRLWDTVTCKETQQIKFNDTPNSIELSRDGQILILAHGSLVELYDSTSLEKLNTFTIPTPVSAASIHPDKSVFVCGGDNFTLYKYSISNGAELGK